MDVTDSLEEPAEHSARHGRVSGRWARGPWDRPVWASLLGRPGWLALVGLALALALVVFLGFFIPARVQGHLLDSRVDAFSRVADDIVADGLIDLSTGFPVDFEEFDTHMHHRLIGVDVVRVIVWDSTGVARYSDHPDAVGSTVPHPDRLVSALAGNPVIVDPNPTDIGFETRSDVESIREYYLPIFDPVGGVIGVLEIYEDAGSIEATVSSTRRVVWLSIVIGLGALLVFLFLLSRASLGVLEQRRRQAERLVAEMARAQESERSRIMGALHDDIGQPLYRVLYGIEGSLSQLESDSPVTEELHQTRDLVRWIDGTLRSELMMLHQGAIDENDLDTLLGRLVEDVRSETHIDVTLTVGQHVGLEEGSRAALFRATREAVTNARKHAGASKIDVTITEGSGRVIVDIEDDGGGFGGVLGLGLTTTRDRLEALGGGLQILGGADGGTLFRAWVPVPQRAER
ncbi:MAG: hypothetical protein IIA44_15470 [Acidobacteria bacterium]|nr:hypothetical protein [Acidobacteriota bacterium]